MPVTFIPDSEWAQSGDIEWSRVGGWEIDQATIPWRGRRDKKKQFEDTIVRFSGMPGYPLMRLSEWSNSGGTVSYPQVDLKYVGFRNGAIPPQKGVNNVSFQSIQSSGTDTSIGNPTSGKVVSGTFYYQATRTTWTWYETSTPPQTPRYSNVLRPIDPLQAITGYSITASGDNGVTNTPVNFVTLSVLAAVTRNLTTRTEVDSYDQDEIIQGALWACSASCTLKLYAGG